MIPRFLTGPDPDLDPDYLRRARYAYPAICRERLDRPIELAGLYGAECFTVEDALEWAEREAARVLA
jgi:hypothetical protein